MSTSTISGETIAGDIKLMDDIRKNHIGKNPNIHTEER
jgi:hypothetical protein